VPALAPTAFRYAHFVPRISIIVPAHDAADTIEETLASALAQTERDLEVVVVDDGSRDETAAIVERVAQRDRRVRLLRQQRSGVAAARNAALAASDGEFVAPLDADDLWAPAKLERQRERFARASRRVGLVYAWTIVVDEAGRSIQRAPAWRAERYVLPMLATFHFLGSASCPLIPRRVLEEVGGYDTSLRAENAQGCEDWDLALRIAERYEFALTPAYLVGYRRRTGSMSSDGTAMWRSYERVMARVAKSHPELPAELSRWSRSQFQLYLATLSVGRDDTRRALGWAGRSIQTDPLLLLSRDHRAALLDVSARALLEPWLALRGTRPRAWLEVVAARFRAARSPLRRQPHPDAEIQYPWSDAPWSIHGRVCRARWRAAERYAARVWFPASDPGPADPAGANTARVNADACDDAGVSAPAPLAEAAEAPLAVALEAASASVLPVRWR